MRRNKFMDLVLWRKAFALEVKSAFLQIRLARHTGRVTERMECMIPDPGNRHQFN